MTKEEAKSKLRKAGYQVVDDNSVVTVLLPKDLPFKSNLNDIRKKLTDMGYKASFSVRQLRDGEQSVTDIPQEDADIYSGEEESFDDSAVDMKQTEDAVAEVKSDTDDASDNTSDTAGEADQSDTPDDDTESGLEQNPGNEDDMSMIISENAVQFSLDDFGLGF